MFGIDIIGAGLLPAMLVALAAGMLSFLSPCVLPIVPPYLAYMSGVSVGDLAQGRPGARGRVMLPALPVRVCWELMAADYGAPGGRQTGGVVFRALSRCA